MKRSAYVVLLIALLGAGWAGSRANDKAPTATEPPREKRNSSMLDESVMRNLFDRWERGTRANMTSFRNASDCTTFGTTKRVIGR
jgi:hypothetical protein